MRYVALTLSLLLIIHSQASPIWCLAIPGLSQHFIPDWKKVLIQASQMKRKGDMEKFATTLEHIKTALHKDGWDLLNASALPLITTLDHNNDGFPYFDMRCEKSSGLSVNFSSLPHPVGLFTCVLKSTNPITKELVLEQLKKNPCILFDNRENFSPASDNAISINEDTVQVVNCKNDIYLIHLKYSYEPETLALTPRTPQQHSAPALLEQSKPETMPLLKDESIIQQLNDHHKGKLALNLKPLENPLNIGINGAGGRMGIALMRKALQEQRLQKPSINIAAVVLRDINAETPEATKEAMKKIFTLWFFDIVSADLFEKDAIKKISEILPKEKHSLKTDREDSFLFAVKTTTGKNLIIIELYRDCSRFIIRDAKNNNILFNTALVRRADKPENILWPQNLDGIIDATGQFCKVNNLKQHALKAKFAVLTAPGKGDGWSKDNTHVPGVNDDAILKAFSAEGEKFISGASCTTNGLAPVLKICEDVLGIEGSVFTTIHSATNSQEVLPKEGEDNTVYGIHYASTGAKKTVKMLGIEHDSQDLQIEGSALRVATPSGSAITLQFVTQTAVTPKDIENIFMKASQESYKNVIHCDNSTDASSKIIGQPGAATVWIPGIQVKRLDAQHHLVSLVIWYDNEGQYVNQIWKLLLEAGHKFEEQAKASVTTETKLLQTEA